MKVDPEAGKTNLKSTSKANGNCERTQMLPDGKRFRRLFVPLSNQESGSNFGSMEKRSLMQQYARRQDDMPMPIPGA
jgi:hypothetical protein